MGKKQSPGMTVIRHLSGGDWKQACIYLVGEVAAAVAVSALAIAELAHLAQSSWAQIFLYDGDSLTLPIIQQAIVRHEPVQWVFSSQFNLFPEGVLYLLCTFLTHSVAQALVLNAILNVVIFYILVRCLIGTVATLPRLQRTLYSIAVVAILCACMLLETLPAHDVAGQSYTTYFLFNTYYSGALLVGMANLWILVRQIRGGYRLRSRRAILEWSVLGLVTILAITSNPLYVVQFLAPFVASLVIMGMVKLLAWRRVIVLCLMQFSCFALALIARLFLRGFVGQPLGSHMTDVLNPLNWYRSLFYTLLMLVPRGAPIGVHVRILLSMGIYAVCLLSALFILNRHQKTGRQGLSPARLFLLIFVSLQPIITVLLFSSGNDIQQRYFIALLIMPLLATTVLASLSVEKHYRRAVSVILVVIFVISTVLGIARFPVLHALTNPVYSDEQCLESALGHQPANGVEPYPFGRALDVYNTDSERVLQVYSDLTVMAWLNNLGAYEHKDFTFVVTTNDSSQKPFNLAHSTPVFSLASLGSPSRVVTCQNITIHEYNPGTPGFAALNKRIQKSLAVTLAARDNGTLTKINGFGSSH